MKITLALLLLGVVAVSARCPNGCSGHGSCGAFDSCSCAQNWIGSDCSERQCPFELAWVDTAYATDAAHYYAECSNKGICDRKTGECKCFDGYEGKGCKRSTCPNDCSGHGTCEFIEELAVDTDDYRVVDPVTRDGQTVAGYTLWDSNKVQGCKCDAGYEGADCSSRTCPQGDDPLTTGEITMTQIISLGDGGTSTLTGNEEISLTYRDPYGARWTTSGFTMGSDSTAAGDMEDALRAIPNHALDDITVDTLTHGDSLEVCDNDGGHARGDCDDAFTVDTTNNAELAVTFPDNPGATGLQYLLECDGGDRDGTGGFQPLSAGTGGVACTTYELTDSQGRDYGENDVCSNRGTCDGSSGTCQCFTGFRGLACEEQEALV